MKLPALMDRVRRRVDDMAEPYLWSNAEIIGYLNESVNEAAVRAQLIRDSSSVLRSLDYLAGALNVPLSPLVLEILRARIDGQPQPLAITSVAQMDLDLPAWEGYSASSPRRLVFERAASGLSLRLWPTPVANGTLLLTVTRLPLEPMGSDDDAPELAELHHERLIDWACRCAYLKQDSETQDEARAAKFEAMFERSFGTRLDANVLRKQADQTPNQVQYREF